MRVFIGALTSILLASTAHADSAKFCAEIPTWPPGSEVPSNDKYLAANIGKPVDAKFVAEHYKKSDWVLIDARADSDRAIGKIPGAVLATSDSKDASKHEFTKEILEQKLGEYFQAKGAPVTSFDDLKSKKIALFCNGRKCHRSSHAACELVKLGFSPDNIFLLLGGFPEWKDAGLPIR
jgi:rhodanese-related sulfurtransferase